MKPDSSPDKQYRTGVSISSGYYKKAKARAEALGHKGFSAYIESLIRKDLQGEVYQSQDDFVEKIADKVEARLASRRASSKPRK